MGGWRVAKRATREGEEGSARDSKLAKSGVDTLSVPVLSFRRISHKFHVDVDSVRYFSLFSRKIEKVLS